MSQNFLAVVGYQALVLAVVACTLWLYTLIFGNKSIVDRYWGLFFIMAADIAWIMQDTPVVTALLIFIPLSLWGIRLAIHITIRSLGKGEDKRYLELEKIYGASWPISSLFVVFLLQIFLAIVISLPITLAMLSTKAPQISLGLLAGYLIFFCGFIFETVADWQLTQFLKRRKNSSEVLSTGLWSLCRHPNYFGDALTWWGLYVISVALGAGWWSIISPILMTLLLMRVSGVTLLEKHLKSTKPAYEEYMKTTNAFFPWPTHKTR